MRRLEIYCRLQCFRFFLSFFFRSSISDCTDTLLNSFMTTNDTVHLYKVILDGIKLDHETGSNKGLMEQVIYVPIPGGYVAS